MRCLMLQAIRDTEIVTIFEAVRRLMADDIALLPGGCNRCRGYMLVFVCLRYCQPSKLGSTNQLRSQPER